MLFLVLIAIVLVGSVSTAVVAHRHAKQRRAELEIERIAAIAKSLGRKPTDH